MGKQSKGGVGILKLGGSSILLLCKKSLKFNLST